jgi:thiol-disulfide isomerase/thioredoxin
MKLKYCLTALLSLFILSAYAQKKLPNVSAKSLNGKVVNLLDTYGQDDDKLTVISFWATWCKPCQNELDAISYLYEDWQENYNVELVAITIDTRRNMAQVGPMVESKGWEYTILSAVQSDMENAFNFNFIPQTLLIDKKGNIVYTHSSYNPGDEDELEKYLEKYAAQ